MKKTHQGDLKRELLLPLLSPLCWYNNYYNWCRWLHGSAIVTPPMWGGNKPPPLSFFLLVTRANASNGEVATCRWCCHH
jgi:hypothetical protein